MVVIIVILDVLLTAYVVSSTISQSNKTIYFVLFAVIHLLLLLFGAF